MSTAKTPAPGIGPNASSSSNVVEKSVTLTAHRCRVGNRRGAFGDNQVPHTTAASEGSTRAITHERDVESLIDQPAHARPTSMATSATKARASSTAVPAPMVRSSTPVSVARRIREEPAA